VLTVTGHGLKDPQWALRAADGTEVTPTVVPVDTTRIADVLGLAKSSEAPAESGPSGKSAPSGPSNGTSE
jgi:threonine synthase